jgi:hypothetical protein
MRIAISSSVLGIVACLCATGVAAAQDPQDNYSFPNPKNERANFFGDWGGLRPYLAQRIGSVHVFRMDSYWLQQNLMDGAITLRAGQMAGWDFFGNHEFGEAFVIEPLNYAFGNIFANTYLTFNPAGVPQQ